MHHGRFQCSNGREKLEGGQERLIESDSTGQVGAEFETEQGKVFHHCCEEFNLWAVNTHISGFCIQWFAGKIFSKTGLHVVALPFKHRHVATRCTTMRNVGDIIQKADCITRNDHVPVQCHLPFQIITHCAGEQRQKWNHDAQFAVVLRGDRRREFLTEVDNNFMKVRSHCVDAAKHNNPSETMAIINKTVKEAAQKHFTEHTAKQHEPTEEQNPWQFRNVREIWRVARACAKTRKGTQRKLNQLLTLSRLKTHKIIVPNHTCMNNRWTSQGHARANTSDISTHS